MSKTSISCVTGSTAMVVLGVLVAVAVDCVGAGDISVVPISPAKAENESASVKTVADAVSLSCFMVSPKS